jgi:hypothetical protein
MSQVVIRAVGFASGAPCPHAGMYLVAYDPDAHDGQGDAQFSPNISFARRFDSAADAMQLWRTTSQVRPARPDGKPNRPLTALHVEIVGVA